MKIIRRFLFEAWIARRFFFTSVHKRIPSVQTIISVLAIGFSCGVAASIFSLVVFIKERQLADIFSMEGHVLVYKDDSDETVSIDSLKKFKGVSDVFVIEDSLSFIEHKGLSTFGTVRKIYPYSDYIRFIQEKGYINIDADSDNSNLIGKSLRKKINLKNNGNINVLYPLLSTDQSLTSFNTQFAINGSFSTSTSFHDSRFIFIPHANPDLCDKYIVFLKNDTYGSFLDLKNQLKNRGITEISWWEDRFDFLSKIVTFQNYLAFFVILVFVIMFLIFVVISLFSLLNTNINYFSILCLLGMDSKSLRRIAFFYSLFLSLFSSIFAFLGYMLFMYFISKMSFIREYLFNDNYQHSFFLDCINLYHYLLFVALIFIISFFVVYLTKVCTRKIDHIRYIRIF